VEKFDFVVIGAGIVGLATAVQLQERRPQARIAIVEKEEEVGSHQSGHNSGVIHAGVYYEPGSLKANLCAAGLIRTIDFCRRHEIPFKQCGKLIVATNELESVRLQDLSARAVQNNVRCARLSREELKEREPGVSGIAALHVHDTGIVDYGEICREMSALFIQRGGKIFLETELLHLREDDAGVALVAPDVELRADRVIACAGLHADRIARLAGLKPSFSVVPFRGDFYRLVKQKCDVVQHLIYPVPDPRLPFLGIHLTPTIDGGMTVGPNAVLALDREGYGKMSFSGKDAFEMLKFPGLWRLLARYPRAGLTEVINSISRRAYTGALQKYCPSIESHDFVSHLSGVRAQAVANNGELIHDFLMLRTDRTTHVCNAPSPAATAALPIADSILDSIGL